MATEPMSTDEPTRSPTAQVFDRPPTKSEQEDYEYIMGQIDALLGRLDVQMPIVTARLDRVLERIKSRTPRS